ncbi:amino acid export carrier protein [Actinoalloteichus sp. AHMU CJ021]|uniref:Uncharacterized membrane protein YjjP, DUF1212 family n=1 Tax=Actinoalloteichus caeruleus DSM 43889 TaxID=1120930 RepID=A0ABT1JKB9_ACTCY|nr:threonine/serine exporter family protein [Actinoalloteichus caeruleus]AUS78515.1 amino acid export carrier protein [Actinoalloteichus sp. AHMU CJ021]MCP2332623.1 Uncharacterized membrane protein YjjP, DUF1212 family [Actinoalloteichus caeruleus DSM 43889]
MGIAQRAREALRRKEATPATVANTAVYGPQLPEASTIHLVLDLALRVGEVQLASGAGAADATATVIAITNAYGLPHCEVDVIYTSITVCCHLGSGKAPITTLRVVRSRSHDYSRLTATEDLVQRITGFEISAEDAYAELERITNAAHPYPRWVSSLAWAGLAASIAVLIGAGPLLTGLAALVSALIDQIGRFLNRRALPFFFQQAVGGAVATGAALLLFQSGVLGGGSASLAVAANLVVLLSGLSVVGVAQDAVGGYNVTAAGRAGEILIMTAGLVTGVIVALRIGVALGAPTTDVAARLPPAASQLPLLVVAGGMAAVCFALASYAPLRTLLVAGGAGALGQLTYSTLSLTALVGPIPASAGAAVVIGFAGGLLARRLKLPTLIVVVSGITPLLPGLATYRAVYQLAAEGNLTAGLSDAVLAAGVSLGLGAGVVLGEFLAQPVRTSIGRLERRFSGPRMSGPLRPSRRRLE